MRRNIYFVSCIVHMEVAMIMKELTRRKKCRQPDLEYTYIQNKYTEGGCNDYEGVDTEEEVPSTGSGVNVCDQGRLQLL